MLKKEFNDILKLALFFIIGILLLPVFLMSTRIIANQSYFSVFFPAFQFGLFFWALLMGASLFSIDRGQRGIEYLLSLPYSRLKLLVLKILPRLISVLAFYIVFVILYRSVGENLAAISSVSFSAIYISLFLIAISLSAISDNFVVLSVVSLFSLCVFFGLLFLGSWFVVLTKKIPYYSLNINDFFSGGWDSDLTGFTLLAALILLSSFLMSFILSFKKFDVRPAKIFNRRFFKLFTPIFIFCFIFSVLFSYQGIDIGYKSYYLTQNHKLIESTYYSDFKIHDGEKTHKIKGEFGPIWFPLEEDEYLYYLFDRKIFKLNTLNYGCDVLYEAPPEKEISYQFWKYDQTITFIEREKPKRQFTGIQLVLMDIPSRKLTRIPIDHALLKKSHQPVIFGTDKIEGRRFWLIWTERNEDNQILKLWEDGGIENIGKSQRSPLYINNMLITYTEKEMIFSKEKAGSYETFHKITNRERFHFGLGYFSLPSSLNNIPLKEIYGWKKGPEYARLNLATLEIDEIHVLKGHLYCFYPGDYYFTEIDKDNVTTKIYEFKEGKLKLLKSFPDLDPTRAENRLSLFKGGIIVERGKRIKAYVFPELIELKF